MERFKFRAWDEEEKVMVYSTKPPYEYTFEFSVREEDKGCLKCFKNYPYCDSWGDEHDHWEPLDNIMMCSNLPDESGKEIYKDDILEFCGYTGVVKFGMHDAYNGWYVETDTGVICELNDTFSVAKICGNVHENPDLLKTGGSLI